MDFHKIREKRNENKTRGTRMHLNHLRLFLGERGLWDSVYLGIARFKWTSPVKTGLSRAVRLQNIFLSSLTRISKEFPIEARKKRSTSSQKSDE